MLPGCKPKGPNPGRISFPGRCSLQEELEKARLRPAKSRTELKAAEAQLNLLKAGSLRRQLTPLELRLSSRAVWQASQAMLEDLQLVSPLDGTVVSRNYETGEFVAVGSPVVTVADLQSLWIKVYVPTVVTPGILGQKPLSPSAAVPKPTPGPFPISLPRESLPLKPFRRKKSELM